MACLLSAPTELLVSEWVIKKPVVINAIPIIMPKREVSSVIRLPTIIKAKPLIIIVFLPKRSARPPASEEDTIPKLYDKKIRLICV
ncbi:hypothetical protein D3C76_1583350 [compost metagenome]